MSLSADLQKLKGQQRDEIFRLHRTYLRTKREIKRGFSPTRIVRRHPGTALGIAAAIGFLLAPRGGRSAMPAQGPGRRGLGTMFSGMIATLKQWLGGSKGAASGGAAAGTESGRAAAGHDLSMVESMVMSLIGTFKLDQLFAGAIRTLAEKIRGRISRRHEGNGRHETATAPGTGDAGTSTDDSFDLRHD